MSHAVMAQRREANDSLDNFPTPPWATRALLEHVIEPSGYTNRLSCLEPACGAGHMASALAEYFGEVRASDIHDYGYGVVEDFLTSVHAEGSWDWIITNPPFRLAEDFVLKSLSLARVGVAVLVRTVFIESVGRFERVFVPHPPTVVAQFVERVPMIKGRLDSKASTATGYAWVIWEKNCRDHSRLVWIPPCRRTLEKADDYIEQVSSSVKIDRDKPRMVNNYLLV